MRSRNDIDVIEKTLTKLDEQTFQNFELFNHDSRSDDGTLAVIAKHNCSQRIHTNDPKQYVPGKVLNEAVKHCNGEIIVFLNSDATPIDKYWLENLIAPLSDPSVGAVFGRQVSRPNCYSLFEKDTERAFGNGDIAARWRHFFSMANSATRKNVLRDHGFRTNIQYSEDIEWSLRLTENNYRVQYVAEAAVYHSHNYNLLESYKRHKGEGNAEAIIYSNQGTSFSFLNYFLLPLCMEVLRDVLWSFKKRSVIALIHSIPLRLAQKLGRWHGANSVNALRQGN
jgi:rhamnosyltransferase